jgi:release factor glutamine methyltransferase
MTRGELLTELAVLLGARHETRFILDDVLGPATGVSSSQLHVSDVDVATARRLAQRRLSGEPLQYVLGHWAFCSLDLLVDPRVLIPRPETEQVVEVALDELRTLDQPNPTIVDAGTGSGAIALALATELAPGTGHIWAIDASSDALAVASANLHAVHGAHNGRMLPVTLIEGSWLTALPADLQGTVTMVVSNPPYVASAEWPDLSPEVHCEPVGALVADASTDGTPGLADVETLLRQAWTWLARPGAVVIELAPHQAEAAVVLATAVGYADVHVAPDLAGRARALVGRVQ